MAVNKLGYCEARDYTQMFLVMRREGANRSVFGFCLVLIFIVWVILVGFDQRPFLRRSELFELMLSL